MIDAKSNVHAGEQTVRIVVGSSTLKGQLYLPSNAEAMVVLACSTENGYPHVCDCLVAEALQRDHIATLLVNIYTDDEPQNTSDTTQLVDTLNRGAERLEGVAAWIHTQPNTRDILLGCFATGMSGGAALLLAARRPELLKAVVSYGGRPDLVEIELFHIHVPTLLITDNYDTVVSRHNINAFAQLYCEKHLAIVPGSAHLSNKTGASAEVARLVYDWFHRKSLVAARSVAA